MIIDFSPKKLKTHETNAVKYMCSAKHMKSKIDGGVTKLRYKIALQKSASKDFMKTFST